MNTEELAKELNRPLVNLGYLCPDAGTFFMEVTFDAKIKEPSIASSNDLALLQAFNERAEAVIAERRARRAAARSGQ